MSCSNNSTSFKASPARICHIGVFCVYGMCNKPLEKEWNTTGATTQLMRHI